MSRTPNLSLLPDHLTRIGPELGARIRLARQHRRLRLEDVADKSGLSRSTVEAVERGSLATSLGAFIAVLGCMGLERELGLVADPGLDREGLALDYSVPEKRVRVSRKPNNAF